MSFIGIKTHLVLINLHVHFNKQENKAIPSNKKKFEK